ncbi:general stress protein [Kocuria sp. cx-455]|uniref:general stress protein n=1 Tax=Kocuria sp. cx-455 TaxID=2771377 RepID=UPI003D733FF5
MSYSSRGPMTLSATAEIPRGEAIARYTSYAEAQKAVDHLADQQFEVAKISIIGSDLKSVEQVTGRLSYPKVALQGALNGVVFGAFFGLLMSLLGGMDLAQALLLPIIMGGAFWMLLATITYAMQRGKRDFTSTNRIVASTYEVIAAPDVAGEARNVLGGLTLPQAPGPRPQHGGWNQPPQGPNGQRGQWGPPQGQRGPQGQYGQRDQRGWHAGPGSQGGAPQQQNHPNGPAQQANPAQGQPQQQGNPAQGQPAQGQLQQGQPQQDANRSAKFPDLPDGRPQYGIRLEPKAPAQSQPQPQPGSSAVNAPWSSDRSDSQNSSDSEQTSDR